MYHYEDAICTKMITVQVVFAKLLPEDGSISRRASNKGKSIFQTTPFVDMKDMPLHVKSTIWSILKHVSDCRKCIWIAFYIFLWATLVEIAFSLSLAISSRNRLSFISSDSQR